MKKIFYLMLWATIFLLPFVIANTFEILPNPTQQTEYTVFRGGSIQIPYSIKNNEDLTMSCSVSSRFLSDTKTIQISPKSSNSIIFTYSAPNKIKSLKDKQNTVDFSISCNSVPSSYSCGFLYLSTCYRTPYDFPGDSLYLAFKLSQQDEQNLAILQSYTQTISGGITTTDSNLKTLKDLIDKTPALFKPQDSLSQYTDAFNKFNTIKSQFDIAIKSIEDEEYSSANNLASPFADLEILNTQDNLANNQLSIINSNIQAYKNIVKTFNDYLSESGDLIKPYSTKSNLDIIDEYNSLATTTKNKLENYQFNSLSEAQGTVDNYKTNSDKFIVQLKDRESEALESGISILKKETSVLCSNNKLCSIKNNLDSGTDSTNLQQVCNLYQNTNQEAVEFNQRIYTKYQSILVKLLYAPLSMSKEDQVLIIRSIIQDVTLQSSQIENDVRDVVKQVNRDGKTVDLANYSTLIQEFNNGDLADKQNLIPKLVSERNNLVIIKDDLLSGENGFILFFKKAYYFIFGPKQTTTQMLQDNSEDIIVTSEEFNNFYSNSCASSGNFQTTTVNSPDIEISNKQSDIKIQASEQQETCYDENGQRTTNCCNSDEYKARKDLYPIIFVHGHAFSGNVQDRLVTFDFMSDYFAQRGYIEKDLLYPEKAASLNKGVWAYCKPIVVRVTYYQGIINGGQVQYKSSIADYAPTLKAQVDAVLTATNKDKAIIVTHSMGGIISRYYIKNESGQGKVDKLITIATPHYGVRDAVSNTFIFKMFFSSESLEMKQNSDFLKALNYPSDSLVNSYTIAGNVVNGGCLSYDCDGLVYVKDAQLSGAKENYVLNGDKYSHTTIYNQVNVSQKVLDIIKS